MDLVTLIKMATVKRRQLSKEFERIAEEATWEAIKAATAATPPVGDVRGTKTRTGELKAHWATDSVTKPQKCGKMLVTALGNNMQYASYVNDGHRMDRHFVPGLYVNPFSGELEYDEQRRGEVGIMVGTKTQYVPGLFMTEKGEEAYKKAADEGIDRLMEILK